MAMNRRGFFATLAGLFAFGKVKHEVISPPMNWWGIKPEDIASQTVRSLQTTTHPLTFPWAYPDDPAYGPIANKPMRIPWQTDGELGRPD